MHFATLKGGPNHGREVAVKVLRPGMLPVIDSDLALMRDLATWLERFWADGKRLKPREVVAEFDKYLHDELDLMIEAANASQLRRNFADTSLLLVPEVFWDWCSSTVFVMERMHGIPISRTESLKAAGVDMHQLAEEGVEIFFTQVFRDGFFHADMHPGNILVSVQPETFGRYIALDFGIVGALSEFDKNYLAQNFIAFFRRDYHRVALLHVESGWVPPDTRVEELESAVRACCEPYFDKPLKEISLGMVLMRLFQTSRRFNVEIQPQLVLLQKTLLNIEAWVASSTRTWTCGRPPSRSSSAGCTSRSAGKRVGADQGRGAAVGQDAAGLSAPRAPVPGAARAQYQWRAGAAAGHAGDRAAPYQPAGRHRAAAGGRLYRRHRADTCARPGRILVSGQMAVRGSSRQFKAVQGVRRRHDMTPADKAPSTPSFTTRNAADPAFWDERFEQGHTPWDLHGVPAEFRQFIAGKPPCPTLVPGCGNGWEAGWLFDAAGRSRPSTSRRRRRSRRGARWARPAPSCARRTSLPTRPNPRAS